MRKHHDLLEFTATLVVTSTCGASLASAQGALVTQGIVLATSGDVVNGGVGEVFAS